MSQDLMSLLHDLFQDKDGRGVWTKLDPGGCCRSHCQLKTSDSIRLNYTLHKFSWNVIPRWLHSLRKIKVCCGWIWIVWRFLIFNFFWLCTVVYFSPTLRRAVDQHLRVGLMFDPKSSGNRVTTGDVERLVAGAMFRDSDVNQTNVAWLGLAIMTVHRIQSRLVFLSWQFTVPLSAFQRPFAFYLKKRGQKAIFLLLTWPSRASLSIPGCTATEARIIHLYLKSLPDQPTIPPDCPPNGTVCSKSKSNYSLFAHFRLVSCFG